MQRQKTKLASKHQATAGIGVNVKRAPQQAQRQGSHSKDTRDPKAPILSPCALFGPDGQERPGWEMWVGDVLFGRADSKESLLQYYARIHEPMPTGHWRERSWQPQRRLTRRNRQDEYGEEDVDFENDMAEGWD